MMTVVAPAAAHAFAPGPIEKAKIDLKSHFDNLAYNSVRAPNRGSVRSFGPTMMKNGRQNGLSLLKRWL